MPYYRLVGGPCDGNRQFNYTRPKVGTVLPCGFHDYVFRADGEYHDAGLQGSSGGDGTSALGTHAPKGWADLQRAVNRSLPTALHTSRALRVATRRKLARRRRLG